MPGNRTVFYSYTDTVSIYREYFTQNCPHEKQPKYPQGIINLASWLASMQRKISSNEWGNDQ